MPRYCRGSEKRRIAVDGCRRIAVCFDLALGSMAELICTIFHDIKIREHFGVSRIFLF